ncbi:MAG: ABC transporter ATP-binding protein [Bacillota bacterium]|nr:ABC transporter ATP-binding protein [Bacillota bacterium]
MSKKLILDFFKEHKLSYIIGIIFMFLSSLIQTFFPKVLGNTIDILRVDNFSTGAVMINILLLFLIAVGTFLSTYAWRNLVIGNGRKIENYIREKLFNHFQKLAPEFYAKRKTGDLIAYAINDISAVRMTFGPAAAMSINGLVVCIASIYSMSKAINWKLTLLTLLPIPVIMLIILRVGKVVQRKFKRVQESFASISDRVQENIYGIRVIKAYAQEDAEVRNFEKLNEQMMNSNLEMVKTSSILSPVIEFCFSISFVLNLIVGGKMVVDGSISLGDFIAFNTYLTLIMAPIISIGRVITIFQRGMASLKRLSEIFDTQVDIKDGQAMAEKAVEGEIEIKNLSFAYPETAEKVLENISLKISKGQTLGILGKTGSGKSTIANLLLKLYNVEDNKILIDGVDINDYSLETLRKGFGYVPQDNFLFSASIKDNIKFFKAVYSDEEVENAARVSCIYDSIADLTEGFDTILGERGVNLSGGQKQRVSIARAIIKNPAVLILDDSLSAVDTITQTKILKNFKNIRKNRTAIIISHRISAIEDADEIIVLDHGRICERGTHSRLLKRGGLYYDIYREQSEALQDT